MDSSAFRGVGTVWDWMPLFAVAVVVVGAVVVVVGVEWLIRNKDEGVDVIPGEDIVPFLAIGSVDGLKQSS